MHGISINILVLCHLYNYAVLWSYQTNSLGPARGKSFMWAAARILQDNGIASFNGYQVVPGKHWKTEYFGLDSKVLVAMLSQTYFRSPACIKELITALEQDIPVTWYLYYTIYIYRCGAFVRHISLLHWKQQEQEAINTWMELHLHTGNSIIFGERWNERTLSWRDPRAN